jgi:hypothetical protein
VATVLTNILVTIENLKFGQLPLLPRALYKIAEPNHRGDIENAIHRMEISPPIL